MPILLSHPIKQTRPSIRYVAMNKGGELAEMEQFLSSPKLNESDRLEELIVNPAILDLASRRGDLDLDGASYVIIRYGKQFHGFFKLGQGHVSIGIHTSDDPVKVVEKARASLLAKAKTTRDGQDHDDHEPPSGNSKPATAKDQPKHAFFRLMGRINDSLHRSFQDLQNYSWTLIK